METGTRGIFPHHKIGVVCLLLAMSLLLPTVHYGGEPGSNPAYQRYDFGDIKTVVRFGTQPLGVLAAVVPEVMRRDLILQKYLAGRGMTFRPLPFYNGPDINHFMEQGKMDLAMAGDYPTMTMATTAEVEIVAIAKRDKAAVVSSKRFETLRDLKGKRVAFPEGTSSHLGLLVVMEAAGLKEQDMKMVPMNIEKLTGALVDKKIDAFAGWEPIPSAALTKHQHLKIVSQFLNTDFLYWSKEFGSRDPAVAKHVLAAYFRAFSWMSKSERNLSLAAGWSIRETEQFLGKASKLTVNEFKQRIRENLALAGSAAIPPNEFDENGYLHRAFRLLKMKGRLDSNAEWSRVKQSLKAELINELMNDPDTYRVSEYDYHTK